MTKKDKYQEATNLPPLSGNYILGDGGPVHLTLASIDKAESENPGYEFVQFITTVMMTQPKSSIMSVGKPAQGTPIQIYMPLLRKIK